MSKHKFAIYLDGNRLGDCPSNLKAAKTWVRSFVLSSHMGEWHWLKHTEAYHYHTTIGRTYCFMKVRA